MGLAGALCSDVLRVEYGRGSDRRTTSDDVEEGAASDKLRLRPRRGCEIGMGSAGALCVDALRVEYGNDPDGRTPCAEITRLAVIRALDGDG